MAQRPPLTDNHDQEHSGAIGEDDTGSPYIRAAFRMDYDVSDVYRLTSAAIGLGALVAVADSIRNKHKLTSSERLLAGVAGASYFGLAAIGVYISPAHVPAWFQRRPHVSQAMSLAPLGLVGLTGGSASPLYRLSLIGVASATGMRERRRETQLVGALAWSAWYALTRHSSRRHPGRPQDSKRRQATRLLAYVLAGRVSPPATLIAYDARALVGHLFAFTYERADLAPYQSRIVRALKRTRDAARDAVGSEAANDFDAARLRDDAIAGLGRLEERLGTLELASRADLDLTRLFAAMRDGHESAMAQTTLHLDADALRARLRERADIFAELPAGLPRAEVSVDDDVVVHGLSRIALLTAITTTAASNAARHATEPVTQVQIEVRQHETTLELAITTDGSPTPVLPPVRARRRTGLAHLRRQLLAFGGALEVSVTHDGLFSVIATLPSNIEPEGVGIWSEHIATLIENGVNDATRFAAARATFTSFLNVANPRSRRPQAGMTSTAYSYLPALSELLDFKGWLRKDKVDTEALMLLANAVLTYRAIVRGEDTTITWTGGFASRYALRARDGERSDWQLRHLLANSIRYRSHERVLLLTLIHVGAVIAGRLRRRSDLSTDDIVSVILGPALALALLRTAQPHVELLDRAISERLAEVESLYELADSFHKAHAAPPKLRPIADLVSDETIARELRQGLFAIDQSEKALREGVSVTQAPVETEDPLARYGRHLRRSHPKLANSWLGRWIWPKPTSDHDPTVGFPTPLRLGHYLASALGRRIWPARINLEFDEATIEHLPDTGLQSAAFRRRAVAALDLVGRELNYHFGRSITGLWNLRQVDMRVSVIPWTGSIECELQAWAPPASKWRTMSDWLHDHIFALIPFIGANEDRQELLRLRLGKVDASLVMWEPYGPERYDREVTIKPPSKRRSPPAIVRGKFAVQLHPQKHKRTAIDLEQRLVGDR